MRDIEKGFLLLTSQLGDPTRPVLTTAQLRNLAIRVRQADRQDPQRELAEQDLVAMGYDRTMVRRICQLLEQEELLQWYLRKGKHCTPLTRVSDQYPDVLRKRLGLDAPGCLWAKGDISLLSRPAVALVGSRNLRPDNRKFAQMAGQEAAKQGFVLVSGNATGADRTAQEACLQAGGFVISVVADRLDEKPERPRVLYLSEEEYDSSFSAQRALSRNRVIHCLAERTLVAQCTMDKGGTWDGTTRNLQHNWSPVFCYADGSAAMAELEQRGATLIRADDLAELWRLQPNMRNFIDQ